MIHQEAKRVAIRSTQLLTHVGKSDTATGARAAGRRYPLFYLKESNLKERNMGMIWMHLHKFCFMIAWGA
jgi:hypothetical protein